LTNINKDAAVQDLLIAEVVLTRILAMNTLFSGLGDILRKYPQVAGRCCHLLKTRSKRLFKLRI